MSQLFNIELGDDFLKHTAEIICFSYLKHTIVVPNRRSLRELKKEILKQQSNIVLPRILALSDYVKLGNDDLVFKITNLLKDKYSALPVNVIFDLAQSIERLVQEFVLNNCHYHSFQSMLPADLVSYWKITEIIFEEVFNNSDVQKIVQSSINKIKSVIDRLGDVVIVSINASSYWNKYLINKVENSNNGVFITCGLERKSVNAQAISNIVASKNIHVPRETSDSIIEQITCPSRIDEAFAIAVAVRKYIEDEKSVLIVSPDQSLSRQVQQQLLRWNIIVDSSIGDVFSQTPAGLLMLSVLNMIEQNYDLDSVVSVLKLKPELYNEVLLIEKKIRTQRFIKNNFFEAIDEKELSVIFQETIHEIKKNALLDLPKTFSDWLELCLNFIKIIDPSHINVIKEMSCDYFDNSELLPSMNISEFSTFFSKYIGSKTRHSTKANVKNVVIVGVIEAQLLHADQVIIAEVNDSSWTNLTKNDFWLTQDMKNKMHLPPDNMENEFFQCVFERLFYKPHVLITRSEKLDGIQQQPYHLYKKLSNECKVHQADWLKLILAEFYKYQTHLSVTFTPPCPPLEKRPKKIYATNVELLFNNPYAFYAKRILRLPKLAHINECENIRGKYIHDVLYELFRKPNENLNTIADTFLQNYGLTPAHFGVWFFRIKKIFEFVINNKPQQSVCEIDGHTRVFLNDTCFIDIAARADRIDIMQNGQLSIVDYKTGTVPTKAAVASGDKPQLLIESLIGAKSGFLKKYNNVDKLCFWKLDGKKDGGSITYIANTSEEVSKLVDNFLQKLIEELSKYNVLGIAYDINVKAQYDDEYKHLARLKEWYGVK